MDMQTPNPSFFFKKKNIPIGSDTTKNREIFVRERDEDCP